jgi:asparagine synthase (glutamine-hydrolysing)
MCGIAGIIAGSGTVDERRLVSMGSLMCHRGPDDEGVWRSADARAGFSHRRLAVIDLSPGGHQPMHSASGRSSVIFNGEIYNYRELRGELASLGRAFRSASDTEVLLEAYETWGTACLERINGMFAFALLDAQARQILLARDRAGEKPLFYAHAAGSFVFASELKALLGTDALPRRLDRQSLEYYLAFGYVPGEMCLLQGVRKLPQGHALVCNIDSGEHRTWAYWRLPVPDAESQPRPDADLERELESLLEDSVRLRLIADVPVGIMLSGGVDSSLITAMAARVAGNVKTFTVSFPGHGRYDEAPFARLVAEHFGTDHVELVAEAANVDLLPQLARQFDEPIADSSMVPTYLVSRQIRQHATVALGGDGGDELFGGYPHYSWLQEQAELRQWIPSAVRSAVGGMGRRLPLGFKGRNYVVGVALDAPGSTAQFNLYFDADARRRLLRTQPVAATRPEAFKAALCRPGASILQQATEVDFQTYLVDDILVKVDRASMLASLEVRAPWLDPRLIEFGFRLPDRLRATPRERKVLPRRLARRLLPSSLDVNRKQGFSLPLDAWFKGDWGRVVRDVLEEAEPSLFDRRFIQELLDAQRRGLGNMQRLFSLTFFELWRREYRVAVG